MTFIVFLLMNVARTSVVVVAQVNLHVLHTQKRGICSKSVITKPISGCVSIACSSLMITSLLQVVNRLAASCEPHAGLMQVVCKSHLYEQCNLVAITLLDFLPSSNYLINYNK